MPTDWLRPGEFTDLDQFLSDCASLNQDEQQPEFRFVDYQGFHPSLITMERIDPALWQYLALVNRIGRAEVDAALDRGVPMAEIADGAWRKPAA